MSTLLVLVLAACPAQASIGHWSTPRPTVSPGDDDLLATSAAGEFVAHLGDNGMGRIGRRVARPQLTDEHVFRSLSPSQFRRSAWPTADAFGASANGWLALAWSISNANDEGDECCERSAFATVTPTGRVSRVAVPASPDDLVVNSSGVSTWIANTGDAIKVWTYRGTRRVRARTLWHAYDGEAQLVKAPRGRVMVVGAVGYPHRISTALVTARGHIEASHTVGTYPPTRSDLGPDDDVFLPFRDQTVWIADGRVEVAVPARFRRFRVTQRLGRSFDLLDSAQDTRGDAAVGWSDPREGYAVAIAKRGHRFRRLPVPRGTLRDASGLVMDSTGRTVVYGTDLDDSRLRYGDIFAMTITADGHRGPLVKLTRRHRHHACGFPEAEAAGPNVILTWTCFTGGSDRERSVLR